MAKKEFLDQLKQCLYGEISTEKINDNISYYSSYIEDEIKSGKSEREVLEGLGDPRLIAKTIIATDGISGPASGGKYYYEDPGTGNSGSDKESDGGSGNTGWSFGSSGMQFNTRIRGILMIIAATLVLGAVLIVVSQIIAFLLPVIVPVIIVMFVWMLLKRSGGY